MNGFLDKGLCGREGGSVALPLNDSASKQGSDCITDHGR